MVAGRSNLPSRDWSAMPKELLASIRRRLPTADFVRFGAVCTGWRRALPSTPAPQLPWLVFPPPCLFCSSPDDGVPCSSPGDGDTYRFFSPSDRKNYVVAAMPDIRHSACVGSCHGWVALVHNTTAETFLVNPITRALIPLPSIDTPNALVLLDDNKGPAAFGFCREIGEIFTTHRFDDIFGIIDKLVTSSEPTAAACKITASWSTSLPPALTTVMGGERWTILDGVSLADLVYHEGEGIFYGVRSDGKIYWWELDGERVLLGIASPPSMSTAKYGCPAGRGIRRCTVPQAI